jgi:hypothetical protein
MFQKFVYWTGALDFLVGFGTWAGAAGVAMNDVAVKGQFVPLVTLGTFLCMAAACLMWASRDIEGRSPVIFWQGLVRLSAILAVIYAVPNALSETWEYALLGFDGPIGLAYVIGSIKRSGRSFAQHLFLRV